MDDTRVVADEELPWSKDVHIIKTSCIWQQDVLGEMKLIIAAHGGSIKEHDDHVLFYFPDGTRREADKLMPMSEHYSIRLPDGFVIRQHAMVSRDGYTLEFPRDSFNESIQARYK